MDSKFMREAIELSLVKMRAGEGGPFGAVVVKDEKTIGRGWNRVLGLNDPTAHAEIVAIREACKHIRNFNLQGCDLYTSCEPCPMCLSAIYWARIDRVYYGNTRRDAKRIAFDDDWIYQEVALPINERSLKMRPLLRKEAQAAFIEWKNKPDRVAY